MRKVAAVLGVSAAGLYRYVASREEVIGHMVDRLSATLPHPDPSGDWLADLTVVARRQRDLYRSHPWLGAAVGTATTMGPHVLDHFEWGLEVLEDVDVPTTRKLEALSLANGLALLFATAQDTQSAADAFAKLDPARHPRLMGLAGATTPASAEPDLFERALASLLGGLLREPEDSG